MLQISLVHNDLYCIQNSLELSRFVSTTDTARYRQGLAVIEMRQNKETLRLFALRDLRGDVSWDVMWAGEAQIAALWVDL